ncbi:MAG: HEAT repeat domain-containing protein [Planctomycetota bacterium]
MTDARPSPDSLLRLLVILVAVLFLGVGAMGFYWIGKTSHTPDTSASSTIPGSLLYDRLHELDSKILKLEGALDGRDRELQSMAGQLQQLQESIAVVKAKAESAPQGVTMADLKPLADQVTSLSAQLASLSTQAPSPAASTDTTKMDPPPAPVLPTDTPEALERQAKSYFERIRPKFQEAIDRHRYDDARWLMMNFPKRLLNTPTGERVQAMAAQVSEQMWADYRNLEKMAEDYAAKGKIFDAIELLKAVPQRFPGQADILARSKDLMVKLQDERERMKDGSSQAPAADDAEVAALIEQMGDEDPKKVKEAKMKLKDVGLRGLGQIRKATVHDNPRVRWGAVTLLGQFSDSQSEDTLISALRDKDAQVRFSALEALRKLGSYKAIDEIVKVAADEDFKLAEQAVRTFESILKHSVLLGNTEITKDNIRPVQESMAIYWERNRKKYMDSEAEAPKPGE